MDEEEEKESKSQLREVFDFCDRDGSGYLSVEELEESARGYFGAQDTKRLVEILYPREHGEISFEEFCAGVDTVLHSKDGDTDVVTGLDEGEQLEYTVGGSLELDSIVMSKDVPPTLQIEDCREDVFTTLDEGLCDSESNSDLINFADVELYETTDEVNNRGMYLQPGGHSVRSNKRPSSNASARILFRSSSPINGHGADYDSDLSQDQISVEDDIQTLYDKIHNLQKLLSELQDVQTDNDDRYEKVKQENVNLMTRIHLLEEQIREHEIKSEEKMKEEQKKLKELLSRHEREKSQEIEDYVNKIHILQIENQNALEEVSYLKSQVEKLKQDKMQMEIKLELNLVELTSLKEEKKNLEDAVSQERKNFMEEKEKNKMLLEQLKQKSEELKDYEDDMKKLERFRSHSMQELPNQFFELQRELRQLKEENTKLQETNEELQAYISNSSIIQELPQSSPLPLEDELETLSKEQLRKLLQEQEEDNTKLKKYIDGILLNIVENYPELLEVKPIL
ncbi:rab11 family-interacting protein 3-like isoform X2 [Centruroides sculpturatus]|uniref:rab11 family-interacting protein 3-like isoform X2 n=1 Tax=Centruroides sculpturatus TaxID=218467 RepID=UPI000C6CDC78|nr:rab11 family-interacting protein 3-like isoform X2 [Centruroides sculpturatus]